MDLDDWYLLLASLGIGNPTRLDLFHEFLNFLDNVVKNFVHSAYITVHRMRQQHLNNCFYRVSDSSFGFIVNQVDGALGTDVCALSKMFALLDFLS